MKKIFSFLTAILFAGSMWGATATDTYVFTSKEWKATLKGESANWTSNKDGGGFSNNGVQVTTTYTGANATSPVSFNKVSKIVVTYNTNKSAGAGSIEVKIGSNDAVTNNVAYSGSADGRSANFTTTFNFADTQDGNVTLKANTTTNSIYVVSIAITYDKDDTAPSLSVDPLTIDFGTVEQGDDVEDQEVEVTFANLTGSVTYAGLSTPFSADGTISATGDKITISANTENIGDFSQTLTVQSTADSKSATVTVKMKVKAPAHKYDITYDFSKINGFSTWSNSYTARDTSYTDADVKFASACRQTGTITDIPVTKGGDVELILTAANKCISAAKFVCRQWTDKAQTITLTYSTDGGENYSAFDPAVESDEFEIEKLSLPTNVTALKISFSSTSNQVGIESVSFDLANKTPTAIDNTEASVKAVKVLREGQIFILRGEKVYTVQGQLVK